MVCLASTREIDMGGGGDDILLHLRRCNLEKGEGRFAYEAIGIIENVNILRGGF